MTDGMLERVARAIEPLAWAALGTGDTARHATARARSLRQARVAIEAREEKPAMAEWTLTDFVRESNRIEGIHREPTAAEIDAHVRLLGLPRLTVDDVSVFVAVCAPGHVLRTQSGLHVRVGNHIAPAGGPAIGYALDELLVRVNGEGPATAYACHIAYETLHPFSDGNGRSGRAIWLWQVGGRAPLGFLHSWYYASLEHAPERAGLGQQTRANKIRTHADDVHKRIRPGTREMLSKFRL